ncbi:MAG: TPM domain-containing protein, partial [Herbiconiux sp.]|nr:TPM domain-containing protein [Herbiconiux sp.]
MGDFSLVPSLVVLLVVVVALVAVSTLLRRRAKQRPAPSIGGAPVREPVDDLLRRASIQLVQMDDAIRAATDELEFTRAEFGEERAHDFAQALDTAKRRASEAFAIQQRLDDAVPDTEQERRDGGKRILALSDAALALVTTQSRSVQEQRRRELGAPDAVRTLRERVASARARLAPAAAEL